MRLPFLQVSQEEMARARTLAGYLGVAYAHALGMTVVLKAAALEAALEDDVSGAILDPNPAEWMAVQCGWPLERADVLAAALVRCGFAMAGPSGGHAVAGMEPYARALDTSEKRSEAGRRGAEARKSRGGYGRAMAGPQPINGDGVASDAKTQTQTQIEDQQPLAAAGASPASQVALLELQAETPPPLPAKKPRKPAEGPNADLWRALAAEYEARMGVPYASGNGGADASTVAWLLAQTTPPEAVRRWGLLLEWSKGGFPGVGGFVALRSHWNAPQVVGLAPVTKGALPPARGHDWSNGLPPIHRPEAGENEVF